jgi:hypothetical protein
MEGIMIRWIIGVGITAAALNAFAADLEMQRTGRAEWVCGGVGAEERAQLMALRKQSNAELVFGMGKRGAYMADVDFTVRDSKRGEPVLQAHADGPICLLKLPPGDYRVEATYEGIKRSANIKAGQGSGGTGPIALNFPTSAEQTRQASAR